jgi:molecular chaperone IbpA
MNQIVRFDTNTLNRALVGFDTMFTDFEQRFANQINQNYPPFNVIKRDEDHYEIHLAVAGFSNSEIDVTVEADQLTIQGTKIEEQDTAEYLHKGLAARNFERAFTLKHYLEVDGAEIKDGLLIIKLERRVPEAMKPKKIAIKTA